MFIRYQSGPVAVEIALRDHGLNERKTSEGDIDYAVSLVDHTLFVANASGATGSDCNKGRSVYSITKRTLREPRKNYTYSLTSYTSC